MNTWLQKTKIHLKDKSFLTSLLAAFLLLIISLVINFYAGAYATEKASNSVTDIVLSNIRVYDVDAMFIYGPVVFWIFIAILLLFEPKRIPFALKSIALFTIIRAIFISLTHIGPFPTQLIIDASKIMDKFALKGCLPGLTPLLK
jgi:uncharacterized membrane protein